MSSQDQEPIANLDNEAVSGTGTNQEIAPTSFQRADTTQHRYRPVFKVFPLIVGCIFLVLGLSALFLFSARAVKFDITPEPDTLAVTSGFITYRLGERFLMLSGAYTFRAEASGYHDLASEIVVDDAPDQEFEFQMQKLPGILTARSEPIENVEVIVDQKSYGFTPLTIDEIEPGLHDVLFKSERYLPYLTEIEIEGRRVEQELVAQLSPAWANVRVSSQPASAEILIDDEVYELSPATIEVMQGKHTISIREKGYKLWQSELVVAAGESITLDTVSLIKADGKISINTIPKGVNVTISDRYHGQTPLSVILAPESTYNILLSKAGFESVRRKITVKPDEDLALNLKMQPVMGVVRLQVQPPDSNLFVNGQLMSPASQRLSLTATRHRIEVSKTGYATYTTTVTPRPGLTQQLMINLKTEEEARVAAIKDVLEPLDGVIVKLIIPDRLDMGASRREPGRRSNEVLRNVLLTRPYYLGIHEISNKAFKEFDLSHDSGIFGRSLLGDDDRPAVNLGWKQAIRFCNWLSEKNDLPVAYHQVGGRWQLIQPVNTGYRLPTEAEWAWAARYDKGTPTRFPWGENMPPVGDAGNYADESAVNMVSYHVNGYNDTYRGSAPVGSFTANNFGIHDLNGNVSEWISDYYSIETDTGQVTDPVGPDSGDYHVIRGANYTSGRFSEFRWTYREYGNDPRPEVGFRIARYVE